MHSFNVLDPQQEVVGPSFLEASAGTGKTFTIEHLVVRLLLETTITLDKILLVTFTRAATRELKQRVRRSLEQSLETLISSSSRVPYLFVLVGEEKQKAIAKLKEAMSIVEQLQVFTIHGFCHHMLKTYAFEAQVGFEEMNIEAKAYQDLEKEQIFHFLRSGLYQHGFHQHQVSYLLKKMRGDLEVVTRRLMGLLHQGVEIPILPNYHDLALQCQEAMQNLPLEEEKFWEELFALVPFFKGIATKQKELKADFLEQAKVMSQALRQEISQEEMFTTLLAYDTWFVEFFTEKELKASAKIPFCDLAKSYPLISFAEKLAAILAEAKNVSHLLLRLAKGIQKRVERACEKASVMTPDDLLRKMAQSLGFPSFCQKVQEHYQAAIIDEFQDTDPVQWTIFHTLFVQDRPFFPLYLVGDPKQSIYGFRNADLPTYLQAAQGFARKFSLNVNYRSSKDLVFALNHLFSADPAWLSEEGFLTYEKVLPNPLITESVPKEGSVHFFIAEQESSTEKHFPSKKVEEEKFFPFIAEEILRLQREGKTFNSFAVLIRDRFQAERIGRFFKERNIPVLMTGSVGLAETAAFSFLRAWIHMVGHSEDIHFLKQVIAHPLMGFSHEHLKKENLEKSVLQTITHLKNIALMYKEHDFLRAWDLFLQTVFQEGGSSFEERLVREDLQAYLDLEQLVEILAEEGHHLAYDALVYALDRLAEKDPDTQEESKRRVVSGEDAVTIMTMHKSKGLEFDIVFALGLAHRGSFQGEIIKCDNQLAITCEKESKHKKIQKEQEEEKLRQLYVALTRAKSKVYVPLCFHKKPSPEEQEEFSPIELFLTKILPKETMYTKDSVRLALEQIDPFGFAFTELDSFSGFPARKTPPELEAIIPIPCSFTKTFSEKYHSSYSKVAHDVESTEKKDRDQARPPSGAETGQLLHKILEKIFERGWYWQPSESKIKALISQELALSSLACFEKEVEQMIHLAMKVTLSHGEQNFSFQDIHPSHLVTEMEFLLEESSTQSWKGFIDLCFCYQNTWYLVDWKSNFLGAEPSSYATEEIEKCMKEHHYFMQANLYGEAISKHLQRLGKQSYGGIFYIFLRGLEHGKGIYKYV